MSGYEIVFPRFESFELKGISPGYELSAAIKNRFRVLEKVKGYVQSAEGKEKLARGLNRSPPSKDFHHVYSQGDFVDVYNPKTKSWEGPFKVLAHATDTQLYILHGNRALQRSNTNTRPHVFLPDEFEKLNFYCQAVSDLCREMGEVFATNVGPKDAIGEQWEKADLKESSGLIAIGTTQVVPGSEVPADAIFLDSGIVRVIKDDGTHKSRWVIKELSHKSERVVERTVPTPSKLTFRILICVALINGWRLRMFDVKQAYLQGPQIPEWVGMRLPRDEAFVKQLPPEYSDKGNGIRIVKPLYGMTDSGHRWLKKFFGILKKKGFQQSRTEPTLFFLPGEGFLIIYVDDGFYCGTKAFCDLVESIQDEITFGKVKEIHDSSLELITNEEKVDRFLGMPIRYFSKSDTVEINMNPYSQKIQMIPLTSEERKNKAQELSPKQRTAFRSAIGKLSWLGLSVKPALACVTSMIAGVKHTVQAIVNINKVIEKFNYTTNFLRFVNLGTKSEAFMYVYVDASLGNNEDLHTQAGYAVFLGQDYRSNSKIKVNLIDWSSSRLRRVTKSTFASELFSFDRGLDKALYIRDILTSMFTKVHVVFLVDNGSVVENVKSFNPKVTEKRLMTVVGEIKEQMALNECEVFHVKGEHQAADCLTKVEKFNGYLQRVLDTNSIEVGTFYSRDPK